MIELFTALALQSNANDCAVLEAVLPEPIEANPIRTERPAENTVEWTGIGLAVFAQQHAPVYADWPEMGDDGVIWSGQYEEAMHWFDTIYPNLPAVERQHHVRSKYANVEPALTEAWGTLPDGLSESFVQSVASLSDWDCEPGEWIYANPEETFTDVIGSLPHGTGLSAHGLTRPGYSADGQWALVYYSHRYQNPQLDDDLPPDPWDSGGLAYLLLHRSVNGWIIHSRYDEVLFN